MAKNGQPITALPYRPDPGAPHGIEVLDIRDLVARAVGHGVDPYSLQRPEFHKLIAVHSGTLRCTLDFTDHQLTTGSWLWVRPGQLHRYDSDLRGARGRVVLFLPGVLDNTTANLSGANRHDWQPAPATSLKSTLDLLHDAYAQPPSSLHPELLRHTLAVLVLRLAALPGDRQPDLGGETFHRFESAVELGFTHSHQVADYATQLGYSVRTLTRATQSATGHGAKHFIDTRVLLEAKRLLIHTQLPATSIATHLGFPDPTTFTKFFRHHTTQTPLRFRTEGL